ncbi:methanogenesis marker 8 protein [Methanobrevibacter sp. DSM 116169]|uniref:methanogenesis marker 8 protein n=1 Tax=Methanobrevibacter sp. DSM 116169 TaxID=3242727 RepID=UPI0038FC9793
MDEHIIEALGKARIKIQNGEIIEIGEPEIDYCPLFYKYRGIETLNKEAIRENIEFRIKDFGMCMPNRELKMKDFLSFGISEIISTLLDDDILDAAIIVCEGCGTIVVNDGELVQGIGGRVSGLVKTTPILEIISKIGKDNIVDPETADIDQIKGIEIAISKGYKNIAVTLAFASDIPKLNKLKEDNPDVNIYSFVVHTTGLNKEDAEELFNNADVMTACASKHIREIGDKESLKVVGQSIPIYARTEKGKEFLERRLDKIGGEKPKKDNPPIPKPLI